MFAVQFGWLSNVAAKLRGYSASMRVKKARFGVER